MVYGYKANNSTKWQEGGCIGSLLTQASPTFLTPWNMATWGTIWEAHNLGKTLSQGLKLVNPIGHKGTWEGESVKQLIMKSAHATQLTWCDHSSCWLDNKWVINLKVSPNLMRVNFCFQVPMSLPSLITEFSPMRVYMGFSQSCVGVHSSINWISQGSNYLSWWKFRVRRNSGATYEYLLNLTNGYLKLFLIIRKG